MESSWTVLKEGRTLAEGAADGRWAPRAPSPKGRQSRLAMA